MEWATGFADSIHSVIEEMESLDKIMAFGANSIAVNAGHWGNTSGTASH